MFRLDFESSIQKHTGSRGTAPGGGGGGGGAGDAGGLSHPPTKKKVEKTNFDIIFFKKNSNIFTKRQFFS